MAFTKASLAAALLMGGALAAGGAAAQSAGPPTVAPREAPTQTQTGTTAPVPNPAQPGVAPTQQAPLTGASPNAPGASATPSTPPGIVPAPGRDPAPQLDTQTTRPQQPGQTTPR